MAVTISPEYPAKGEEFTFTTDTGDDEVARYELTSSKPDVSALTPGMVVNARTGAFTNTFTPDVAGTYVFKCYNYRDFTAAPMFPGDPTGTTRTELLSVETVTVHVGEYMVLPIKVVSGHSATLKILVVEETVRDAFLTDFATELARVAALDATVAAAVAALIDEAVNDLDEDFISDTQDLGDNYERHRVSVSSHAVADTTNALFYENVYSVPAAIRKLNDIAAKLFNHQIAGTSGGIWHIRDDTTNMLQVAPTAASLGEAIVLKADLRERAFERHRVTENQDASPPDPDTHTAEDTTNVMPDPLPLPAAIVAYLDFIATNAPNAAATESEGVADAQAAFGFRVAA